MDCREDLVFDRMRNHNLQLSVVSTADIAAANRLVEVVK